MIFVREVVQAGDDADAGADFDPFAIDQVGLCDGLAQPIRQCCSRGRVAGPLLDHGELVTTEPGNYIASPCVLQQSLADDCQKFVADGMPVSVVDVLEAVQIEQVNMKRILAATAAHVTAQAIVELAPVEQVGQGIVTGEMIELPLVGAPSDHAYGKRPREELFDLEKDPHQMHNVAALPEYATVLAELRSQLLNELQRSGDPRMVDDGKYYETPPLAGPFKQ